MDDHAHDLCRDCPRTWERIADLEACLEGAEADAERLAGFLSRFLEGGKEKAYSFGTSPHWPKYVDRAYEALAAHEARRKAKEEQNVG